MKIESKHYINLGGTVEQKSQQQAAKGQEGHGAGGPALSDGFSGETHSKYSHFKKCEWEISKNGKSY